MYQIAYFVGGPSDGEMRALPSGMHLYFVAELRDHLSVWQSTEAPAELDIRTVAYQPATLGGFLWYASG
jgi:hypothetical protein